MRRRLLLAAILTLVPAWGCSPAGPAGNPATPQQPAAVPSALLPGAYIKHVVIIVQENRSFENFFAGWPGADAPMYGYDRPCKPTERCKRYRIPLHETTFKGLDLVHSYGSALIDVDGGAMDGFGRPTLGQGRVTGKAAYAYVKHALIAPYRAMASQYTLADRMFPSELGASFTAHLDLIAGTTDLTPQKALVDTPTGTPWGCDAPSGTITWTVTASRVPRADGPRPCLDQFRTMADALDAEGISWNYYEPAVFNPTGSWSAFDAIANVRDGGDWARNVLASTPQTNVLTDPAQGRLASVAWVTPDFYDSDHLNSESDTGPSWVAAVVNAIGESPAWNSTAIIVLWDDWGGWYDNAVPPNLDFRGLGIRVPCLIISPYARKHYVSHTTYEFGSVLRFVEQTFGVPPLGTAADGYTDARANSILDAFDFTQAPSAFVPIPAPYPAQYFLARPPSYRVPDEQ
ncbi:MAG: hypothetical protein JOY98_09215 [Candidatus Eremiobacteraeota bacterium]|nr:hypothetical protein [Candidatus Eremiobacteraeota bacterium]